MHFGNRSISLEQLGGPSALVIAADTLEELSRLKVKEALCYLSPEQTGSIETTYEDHRTDLYSLGILFWTLLAGQGQMPFEGSPTEILHAIAQKRPMPVHEFRRDVPHVVAMIIERVLIVLAGYNELLLLCPFSYLQRVQMPVIIAPMVLKLIYSNARDVYSQQSLRPSLKSRPLR